jgi:hypothetical protein
MDRPFYIRAGRMVVKNLREFKVRLKLNNCVSFPGTVGVESG